MQPVQSRAGMEEDREKEGKKTNTSHADIRTWTHAKAQGAHSDLDRPRA